jgi:hypothetical protein
MSKELRGGVDSGFGESKGIIVLFVKQVHLQNDAGASHQIGIVSRQPRVSDSDGKVALTGS